MIQDPFSHQKSRYSNLANSLRLEAETIQRDMGLSEKDAMHLASVMNPGSAKVIRDLS